MFKKCTNDFVAEFILDDIKLYRKDCGIVLNKEFELTDFYHDVDNLCYDTAKHNILIAGANRPTADIKNILFSMGFPDALFVQPVFALASYFGYDFGAGENITPIMTVAICENTTDIAIIEGTKIIHSGQINIGMRTILEELSTQFAISIKEAKRMFTEIGSLLIHDMRHIRYPDYVVTADNVRTVIYPFYEQIWGAINHILSEASIDTIRSIKNTGIFIGGSGANIYGLKDAVYAVLGLNALIAKDTDNAIIYGAGELLNDVKLLLTLTSNT